MTGVAPPVQPASRSQEDDMASHPHPTLGKRAESARSAAACRTRRHVRRPRRLRALALALLAALGAPALAADLRLDWTLSYAYPPNPCVAGGALVRSAFGLFEQVSPTAYRPLHAPNPGPPDLALGARASGSVAFTVAEGTSVFGAYDGHVSCPDAGPRGLPVHAFPNGTAEGDAAVESDPGTVQYLLLGTVRGGQFSAPDPGPPDLPLFAFASPGQWVGTAGLWVSVVPEPAGAWLLLAGLAAAARLRRGAPAAACG
jgi:hypothetical protein